jgi:hypothetical protein
MKESLAPPRDPGRTRLLVGLLAPPLAWIIDLGALIMLTRTNSARQITWPVYLVTAAALALTALGGLVCWRACQITDAGRRRPRSAALSQEATITLASWGLALAVFFALLIVAQAYPSLVLTPTEIT